MDPLGVPDIPSDASDMQKAPPDALFCGLGSAKAAGRRSGRSCRRDSGCRGGRSVDTQHPAGQHECRQFLVNLNRAGSGHRGAIGPSPIDKANLQGSADRPNRLLRSFDEAV